MLLADGRGFAAFSSLAFLFFRSFLGFKGWGSTIFLGLAALAMVGGGVLKLNAASVGWLGVATNEACCVGSGLLATHLLLHECIGWAPTPRSFKGSSVWASLPELESRCCPTGMKIHPS